MSDERPEPPVYKIDYTVYPDLAEPPERLDTIAEKADYLARICGAWDLGVIPTDETFELFSTWREIADSHPLPQSIAYHALRAWFEWPPVPATIIDFGFDSDAREGRTDPCAGMV